MDSPELAQAVDALRRRLDPGTRTILGIAGAPGSGKSTLAARLQEEFGAGTAVVVPMDGFHLGNAVIDGTPLRARKGAMDTFDAGGYLSLLRRLAARDEAVVYAPEFRRTLDEPVAASIAVPADVPLVITEGNYLLADQEPWKEIRAQLDEVWFLETPHELRISRLVARHVSFGMPPEAAEAWANGPDEANAVLIRSTRHAASHIIPWR
ncbi:phosphoribulokinase/uridine kinase [Pseudarthrobacter chlorophenolicus A6]|uniref:Phosphoribulokinase/uridine kinase n=1 Tax=Pseudarthrobacter chlorophenolicus (strain ATCC 700700 / DSM 12829 / CIP 107037 / JCM 12360 / KCTC 9906 / NCIMB 13794 / A6) TaxID=452863 RepID=B8HHF8_PSECP|nr:nucleoside/nucleotide kinase family protein [Pseudarthrobacter chlorophenolicus]ACL41449.1 phosphoribulokinase/uridine kinase [Pseudarthrobacter chlorophenolicus A6]SDQ63945.1 Panthothenate kinase [Pseudarthrobacter chlorophenolicus]